MPQEIKLPVKNLAAILQSGSIDNRFGGKDRMQEGSRVHRMLQKQEGPSYQPEVFLSLESERNGFLYQVQGRADGVLTRPDGVVIDEIKTTGYPTELITEEFDRAHWGQAMCYAHFYCVKTGLERIGVRLSYFQVDTEEIKRFERSYTAGELRDFYDDLLDRYEMWAKHQSNWVLLRDGTIHALPFPFEQYRGGQRQLAVAVYRTIERQGRLFCQAPTGIGKTMSTLFPSLKAMGEGLGEKIFYLTAKTVTRMAAEEALSRMRDRGLRVKSVTLTAKDKICFQEERDCNPEQCPYANGYYDRINDALYKLLQEQDALTRESIEACARENTLCPFELSLDLTLWCDVVICDYNYLFDPVVNLKRLLSEDGGDYTFLIDEAHNLVDRSREMYSARLSKQAVLELRKKCRREKRLCSALARLNGTLASLRKRCGEEEYLVDKELPSELTQALYLFTASCDEWLQENKTHSLLPDVLELYFAVSFFQRIAELYDEHYVTYLSGARRGLDVELLCLDTSLFLDECMKRGRASILFSATLSPLDYFMDVLGGGPEAHKCRLSSPFPSEHMRLLIADRISTKYTVREESYGPIADMLYTLTAGRRGNYLAYFPSYKYLSDVCDVFQERYPEMDTLVQSSRMSEGEREAFLSRFDTANDRTLLGFCVLGGIYSEGIDLQGDRLIGTAVIGVGLPQVNVETDLLKRYYDEKCGMGFEFSYRYPGMNKVLQAAGRVIRGMEDRGVVLLIDSRFTASNYRRLFPPHWEGFQTVRSTEELSRQLRDFWEK